MIGPDATDALKARLMADAQCEHIALFGCTTEGHLGRSGEAINERGELMGWWLFPDGHLDIRRYDAAQVAEINGYHWDDPEYQQARDEIGEWLARKWISPEPLTPAELAQAQRFVARHGWLKAE